jgi:phospholipid/cholesterol/gamma-HCH transport system substrate-binding protein
MSRNAVETVMGAVVLIVAALFLFFAYTTSQVSAVSGYQLTARFNRVEGLRDGGDVRISGIKVGSIVSQTLDAKTFVAVVKMSIDPSIKLPVDTVATITSAGLFGDKYLSLEPGNEDDLIKPGGEIDHTQSPMSLESLIGQYIFSQQPAKSGEGAAPAPGAAPPGAAPQSATPPGAPPGAAAPASNDALPPAK